MYHRYAIERPSHELQVVGKWEEGKNGSELDQSVTSRSVADPFATGSLVTAKSIDPFIPVSRESLDRDSLHGTCRDKINGCSQ